MKFKAVATAVTISLISLAIWEFVKPEIQKLRDQS